MAILLFRLKNVPDDEAMEIRELLAENDIYFYETNAGMWRIGLDAIWLADTVHEVAARELIKNYQAERELHQQKNYAQLVARGEVLTFWQQLRQHPIHTAAGVIAIVFVLLLTFAPFALMFKH